MRRIGFQGFLPNWRQGLNTFLLLCIGLVIIPLTTWWYIPSVLWWVFRSVIRSVSALWVLVIAIVLSAQMAFLWSLPIGLLLIITILLLWSLDSILRVRQRSIRWSLEILHGFLVTGVLLGLSQSITTGRVLFNCLAVLIFITGLIIMGQLNEQ